MSWLFRRRIKIIPGVRLNLSKSGVTASVGVRGASVTLGGNRGDYLNVGVPGTGIYSRTKINGGDSVKNSKGFEEQYVEEVVDPDEVFISADPLDITSEGLQVLQDAVFAANKQRRELKHDLSKIRSSIFRTRLLKLASKILLIYFLLPQVKHRINKNISLMRRASREVEDGIKESVVILDLEMTESAKFTYKEVISTFENLSRSNYIWDMTSSTYVDMAKERSAASALVERKKITINKKDLSSIRSTSNALFFENKNGADIYLYPGFIVMHESEEKFGLLEMANLDIKYEEVQFIESETIPTDSIRLGEVWEKSNKDGSRDKRFAGNRQIPLMAYGEISLSSSTGIYEKYMFSDASLAKEFVEKINEFKAKVNNQKTIKRKKQSDSSKSKSQKSLESKNTSREKGLELSPRKNKSKSQTTDLKSPVIDQSLPLEKRWENIKQSGIPLGPSADMYLDGLTPTERSLASWERLIVLRGSRKDKVAYKIISSTDYLKNYAGKTWGEILGELTDGATLVDGKQTWEIIEDKEAKQDLGKMLACCNAELAAMYATGQHPAPAYFKRAAILFRKAKLYEKEIQICEFYISLMTQYCELSINLGCKGLNWEYLKDQSEFRDRSDKAKVLWEKEKEKAQRKLNK